MKMLVIRLCPTLQSIDYTPPGSSVLGILQARILEWGVGCHALLRGIFLTQGLHPGLPHCRQVRYHLSPQVQIRLYHCLKWFDDSPLTSRRTLQHGSPVRCGLTLPTLRPCTPCISLANPLLHTKPCLIPENSLCVLPSQPSQMSHAVL